MFGRVCYGLLFIALLPFAAPTALAEVCAMPLEKPAVEIRTKATELSYDSSVGLRALTKEAQADGATPTSESIYNMGLTKISWDSGAQLRLQGRPEGNSYCWSVTSLDMTVTETTTVYIAQEIEPKSCIWREVHAHELKHVALDKKMFARLRKAVLPKIEAAVVGAVLFEDGDAAMAYFRKKGEKAMSRALIDFSNKRQKEQRSTIDTKEEYARVDAACSRPEWAAVFKRAGFD